MEDYLKSIAAEMNVRTNTTAFKATVVVFKAMVRELQNLVAMTEVRRGSYHVKFSYFFMTAAEQEEVTHRQFRTAMGTLKKLGITAVSKKSFDGERFIYFYEFNATAQQDLFTFVYTPAQFIEFEEMIGVFHKFAAPVVEHDPELEAIDALLGDSLTEWEAESSFYTRIVKDFAGLDLAVPEGVL